MPTGLTGARVVCLESRRSKELGTLIEKQGGTAIVAPSMQELPLAEQHAAVGFADVLEAGQCDVLLLLTGVGTRLLIEALHTRLPKEVVRDHLSRLAIYCRGPKPVPVLREFGLVANGVAPEPNRSEDLLRLLRATEPLAGQRIYVQEYGRSTPELSEALTRAGAEVASIPVYAWGLPDDLGPLEGAVRELADASADAVVFTSAQQLEHLVLTAERLQRCDALLASLRTRVVVASIGPVTSEALERHGVAPDLVPVHPKMGQLVSELGRSWPTLRDRKRASH